MQVEKNHADDKSGANLVIFISKEHSSRLNDKSGGRGQRGHKPSGAG